MLALIAIVLVAAVLAAGVTASTTIADRRGRLEALRSHTEPLADAAQRIYGALSIANTAATTFLSGGIEPQDVRYRYDEAIGQVSAGLVTASNGVPPNDVRSLTLLTDLSNRPAVYTGMIATARANKRAGRPIGVAYVSEASALMQQAILPSAEQLYRTQADAMASTERSARPSPAVIAASVFALSVLVLAQAGLTRRSHRRLNPGLVRRVGAVEPGSEAQIDYGRLGMWLDPVSGRRVAVWVFAMTLSCSRALFVQPVLKMGQVSWNASHVAAFEFFGGVPARLVCDTSKPAPCA